MEGSESEAVFDSLNLNPQLFINEVLNTVDDLVDDAFNYFLLQASSTLKTEVTDRSEDLTKGMAEIRKTIQSILDKRLSMWEEYCLNHCFEVPEGFSLPKTDEPSGNNQACQDELQNPELDAELESLRNKLIAVGKDSAVINRELRALEQQSVAGSHITALITEAMQSYDQNSMNRMFEDLATTVSELKTKMGNLKKRGVENTERARAQRFHTLRGDSSALDPKNGFADARLEDLQDFLAKMKKMRA